MIDGRQFKPLPPGIFDIGSQEREYYTAPSSFDSEEAVLTPLVSGIVTKLFNAGDLGLMQETWVQSLGWEDSLEKGMATHSSILAWRIPWTKEPGYRPWDCKGSDTTEIGRAHV